MTGMRASGDRDDGEHAHGTGVVRERATGTSYAPHYGVQGAAPLLLGRHNDEKDGDRRRAYDELRRHSELEEEQKDEDAQEKRELTLDSLALAVVQEEAGIDGNRARWRRPVAERKWTASTISSFPGRFLRRRGRGR